MMAPLKRFWRFQSSFDISMQSLSCWVHQCSVNIESLFLHYYHFCFGRPSKQELLLWSYLWYTIGTPQRHPRHPLRINDITLLDAVEWILQNFYCRQMTKRNTVHHCLSADWTVNRTMVQYSIGTHSSLIWTRYSNSRRIHPQTKKRTYARREADQTCSISSSSSLSSMVRGFSAPIPALLSWPLLAYDLVAFMRAAGNVIGGQVGIMGGTLCAYTRNKLDSGLSSSSELSPPLEIVIDRNERAWLMGGLKSMLPKPDRKSRVRFGAFWVAKLAVQGRKT